jgi:pyridoxamine 5'-phosphate oxidase
VRVRETATLATASADGAPSARIVLLHSYDKRGFVVYTGYAGRKARELEENPRGLLLFHWDPLGRQVRLEGPMTKVSREESAATFATRPPSQKIAVHASRQSEVVPSRDELEARVDELRARYPEGDPPYPDHWGGYRLAPVEYEFWQHREDRLHDRFRYRLQPAGDWLVERLSP